MSLENLVKINKLNPHVSNAVEVGRLLAAARRNVADDHQMAACESVGPADSIASSANAIGVRAEFRTAPRAPATLLS